MRRHLFTLFLLLLLLPCPGWAQAPRIDTTVVSSDDLQVLRTKREDIFFGRARGLTIDSVVFIAQEGLELRYRREDVDWLGLVKNAAWLNDLSANNPALRALSDQLTVHRHENLLYSSTAFPYPRGGGEYRNIDLLYNTVDFGLSDNFSLGGGSVIPFLLLLRAKLSFEVNEKVHLGLAMNHGLAYGEDMEGFASHFFGIATVGSPETYLNLTFGPAIDWTFSPDSPLVCTIGGGLALGDQWRVYTDIGFSIGYPGVVPSMLFSWFNARNRLEFGVLTVPSEFFITLPMLGYARKF